MESIARLLTMSKACCEVFKDVKNPVLGREEDATFATAELLAMVAMVKRELKEQEKDFATSQWCKPSKVSKASAFHEDVWSCDLSTLPGSDESVPQKPRSTGACHVMSRKGAIVDIDGKDAIEKPLSKQLIKKHFEPVFIRCDFTPIDDEDIAAPPPSHTLGEIWISDGLKHGGRCDSEQSMASMASTSVPSQAAFINSSPYESEQSIASSSSDMPLVDDNLLHFGNVVNLPRSRTQESLDEWRPTSLPYTPRPFSDVPAALENALNACKTKLAYLEEKDAVSLDDCSVLVADLAFLSGELLVAACSRKVTGAMDLYEETNEAMERVSILLDCHGRPVA